MLRWECLVSRRAGLWPTAWLILTGIASIRLLASLVFGLIVARRADPLPDDTLSAAAARAAARLGVGRPPELRRSPRVRCPAIWCWRRRPLILMPQDAASAPSVDWAGVFAHELAHWVRRDHVSALVAEILTCLLPWQPLAWWARHRLGQLSELACDDWALSTGLPPADYAESLLELVPQRRGGLALTAVSSRYGLIGRVQHVLDSRQKSPVIGWRWALASAAAVVVAASVLALAQTRPAKDQTGDPRNDRGTADSASKALARPTATGIDETIKGKVLGPDGQPASGVAVWWIGRRKPSVSFVRCPRIVNPADRTRPRSWPRAKPMPRVRSLCSADYDPERYQRYNGWDVTLVAKARGTGMLCQRLKSGATAVTLRLAPEIVIHGRLITPSGTPAVGIG